MNVVFDQEFDHVRQQGHIERVDEDVDKEEPKFGRSKYITDPNPGDDRQKECREEELEQGLKPELDTFAHA